MSAMESALCPLGEHLSCQVCKQNLSERVKQLVVQWSVVKVGHSASCTPYMLGCDACMMHILTRMRAEDDIMTSCVR